MIFIGVLLISKCLAYICELFKDFAGLEAYVLRTEVAWAAWEARSEVAWQASQVNFLGFSQFVVDFRMSDTPFETFRCPL